MARDAEGNYWYSWQEAPNPDDSGVWVHQHPGFPGAIIGSAPHTGSLDSFIEKAIPLGIAALGTAIVALAGNETLTSSFAAGAKTTARESSTETPVGVEPMWEEDESGDWFPDFPTTSDESGTSIFNDLGSIIAGGGEIMGGAASLGGLIRSGAGGGMVGSMAAGAATLGARLASMFGRSSGSFVINGIKGSMSQLWPAVRRYGPTAVAAALGIGAASLAELLMRAPTNPRKRARGISARDLRTTARVGRFNRKVNRLFGTGRSRGRSYRPHTHRHAHRY